MFIYALAGLCSMACSFVLAKGEEDKPLSFTLFMMGLAMLLVTCVEVLLKAAGANL